MKTPLLKIFSIIMFLTWFAESKAQNDLPPPSTNIETIPAGAWIIPMDNTLQGNASGIFKLKTYGLLNQLLWNNIHLKWAIKTGKAKDATDFNVVSDLILPTSISSNLIAGANFEVAPLSPNWTYTNIGGATNTTANKFNGGRSWRMGRNMSITMANTSLVNYSNVQLSVAFASIGNPPNNGDLHLDISYDNGVTWTGAGSVKLADGDGATSFNINTTNGNTVAPNPYIVNIPGTASQIRVRLRTTLGTWLAGSFYYVDDIRLTGTYNRPYVSGPFIIMPADTAAARTVINTYNTPLVGVEKINIYKASNSFNADIRYTVSHKPKIAIYDDGGNAGIHSDVLDLAGITSTYYTIISEGTIIDSINCYTIASTPHWGVSSYSSSDSARLLNLKSFLRSGGNFLAQCEGLDAIENFAPARYITTNGINTLNAGETIIEYKNTDMPVMQFHGVMEGTGGSIHNFNITSGSWVYPRYVGTYFVDAGDTASIVNVTKVYNTPSSIGGNMVYLGGHDYMGSNIDNINGMRIYLNAVMMPAKDLQAQVTATSNSPVCPGDTIKLIGNIYGGFNFSWSGPNGFSSTLQNPVIPNAKAVNSGTYTLTMTVPAGGGGCAYTYNNTAVVVNKPSVSVVSTAATICRNDSVTLSLSSNTGLSTVNWYINTGVTCTPNGTFLGTGFTKTVAPLNTTKYIAVGITTSGGCRDTTTNCYTVIVDTLPILTSPNPTSGPLCYGRGSYANIAPGGGGSGCTETYQWRMDGGSWQAYTSGAIVGANANDSVEIRANRNCTSGCMNKIVRLKWNVTQPQTTVGTGDLITCITGAGFIGTLTSTNPTPSSGLWSIFIGPGTIASTTSFNTTIAGLSKTGQLTRVGWVVTNSYGCKDTAIINFIPPVMDSSLVSKYAKEYCLTCPVQDGNTFSYYDLNGKLLSRVTDSVDAVAIGNTTMCAQLPYNVPGNPTVPQVLTVNSWLEGVGFLPQPYLPRAWNLNTTTDAPMTVKLYFTEEELAALTGASLLNGGYYDFGGAADRLLLVAYPNNSDTFVPPASPNGIVSRPQFQKIGNVWEVTFRFAQSATFYLYPPYWAQFYGLPVELMEFKAEPLENSILLDWTTASEIDNSKFEVERALNTRDFMKIGEVAGAGNQRGTKAYSFEDEEVIAGQLYYYRLKQIDFSGKFEYSKIVSASIAAENKFTVSEFLPNPTANTSIIKLNTTSPTEMEVTVYRIDGSVVKSDKYSLEKGQSDLIMDVSALDRGIYMVQFSSKEGKWIRKLMKLN